MSDCEYQSSHHSDDLVTIWHGSPEPIIACGFHASMVGPAFYRKVKQDRAAVNRLTAA